MAIGYCGCERVALSTASPPETRADHVPVLYVLFLAFGPRSTHYAPRLHHNAVQYRAAGLGSTRRGPRRACLRCSFADSVSVSKSEDWLLCCEPRLISGTRIHALLMLEKCSQGTRRVEWNLRLSEGTAVSSLLESDRGLIAAIEFWCMR